MTADAIVDQNRARRRRSRVPEIKPGYGDPPPAGRVRPPTTSTLLMTLRRPNDAWKRPLTVTLVPFVTLASPNWTTLMQLLSQSW